MGIVRRREAGTRLWPLAAAFAFAAVAAGLYLSERRSDGPTPTTAMTAASTEPTRNMMPWAIERERPMAEDVARNSDAQIVFLGDSITQFWEAEGSALWSEHFDHRALNLGVAGDETQHVLYRLGSGQLDGLNPDVAVIQIGTNNAPRHNAQEIVDGIRAVVDDVRSRLPEARILVYGPFPRTDSETAKDITDDVRDDLATALSARNATVVRPTQFSNAAGQSRSELLQDDGLHLSELGYGAWLESLLPLIDS